MFGPRWDLHPRAFIWARLPREWVRIKVAGRKVPSVMPRQLPLAGSQDVERDLLSPIAPLPAELVGERWSTAPRDMKLPVGRFWPNGELPIGPDYATSPTPNPVKRPKAKLKIAHDAEPKKPRRPSGIGLPSGYERAESDFYIEPRWLVHGMLKVEHFVGAIYDPFVGGGNIVGACLERGLSATGSDLYDRGYGERRDAFSITEPLGNVISNPPFARIEDVIRHFLPLVQHKLVLLARLNILEGQERRALFDASPPARVWVSSRRASMPPGDLAHPRDQFGAMIPLPASGGSTAYCFVVWDRNYSGPPVLGWL